MSVSGYVSYPIPADSDTILQDAYAYIKSRAPSWRENDGNLDTWILQLAAREAGDLRETATDVPDSIFRYLGASLFGVPPITAVAASVGSTWTVRDAAGYTIPAGTFVSIRNAVGEDVPFQTIAPVVIPVGSQATAAGEVILQAVDPGAAGSNLGGVGVAAQLITTFDWVTGIVLTSATSGGQDAETNTEYLDRLADRLRRLSTTPILPDDVTSAVRDIGGVYRAVALDGYDPSSNSYGNERMVSVAAVDENGIGVSAQTRTDIDNMLEATREVNFVFNVIAPNYTSVDVSFTVKVLTGFDSATTVAAAIAAVQDYLDPAVWGRDPRYTDVSSARTWVEVDHVYYNEMIALLSNVSGVDRVTALTMAVHGNALLVQDVQLTTPAALPQAGTITGAAA